MQDALSAIRHELADLRNALPLLTEQRIEQILAAPRYREPGRLARHEFRVYSQNGEDGILAEIFSRIGVKERTFAEFGVEDGLQNNSLYLLQQGWSGAWIEADPDYGRRIRARFANWIGQRRLTPVEAFATAENAEALLRRAGVPAESDLLSIDVDGNEYWIWKAISSFRPRVVAIEYNAQFRPDVRWIMKYDPAHVWDGTSYFGASLKALEMLGNEKGCRLVGCSLTGVNAFFVREDLAGGRFAAPFTAENHYEPPRYHFRPAAGYPPGTGDYEPR